MELAGGEAFLGGAVAGGAEGVEEAGGEVDFAGEEAARGFLTFGDVALARHSEQAPSALALCNVATAIKIGHSQILLELIYCHTFFLLRFYN